MINIVDVKSLRSTVLVFCYFVMKKSSLFRQWLIDWGSPKNICIFLFFDRILKEVQL